jgi:hypothetical protein
LRKANYKQDEWKKLPVVAGEARKDGRLRRATDDVRMEK